MTKTAHAVVYKTSVSHFNVTKTPLKDTDGKGNIKTMLSFLLVDKGRLFFPQLSFKEFEIHKIFFMADRSLWPVFKQPSSENFEEFSGTFCTLTIAKKMTFLKGHLQMYVFVNIHLRRFIHL